MSEDRIPDATGSTDERFHSLRPKADGGLPGTDLHGHVRVRWSVLRSVIPDRSVHLFRSGGFSHVKHLRVSVAEATDDSWFPEERTDPTGLWLVERIVEFAVCNERKRLRDRRHFDLS